MENRRELDYVKEGPNFPTALIAVEGICWFNTSISLFILSTPRSEWTLIPSTSLPLAY